MIKFESIPLKTDILENLLKLNELNNSILLFPTKESKSFAQQKFQSKPKLNRNLFLTFDEFRRYVFRSENPILKEEKRILALWGSLNEEIKDEFNIKNYFQSIEFANRFFKFWEDLNYEMVELEDVESIFRNALPKEWQISHYRSIIQLKASYKNHLEILKYSDKIFTETQNNIDLSYFSTFSQIFVINKFHYTKLDQLILNKFNGNVFIYRHLPQNTVNNNFNLETINIDDFKDYLPKRINIHEAKNPELMQQKMFNYMENAKPDIIIDFQFDSKIYSDFFSPMQFEKSHYLKFSQTSIFNFLKNLYRLIENLIWEPNKQTYLIPIESILKSLTSTDFLNGVINKESNQINIITVKKQLCDLLDKSFLYFDLDNNFYAIFRKLDIEVVEFLNRIFSLIKQFINVNNLESFCKIIDNPKTFELKNILRKNEVEKTEISDIFYNYLSDFISIEEVGIISNWFEIFPKKENNQYTRNLGQNILKLFLEYMKSRKVVFNHISQKTNKIKISNLQDTQNLSYNNLFMLNINDGTIPSQRKTPFLFSEYQRKLLGLATHEHIWLKEKYFFLRMIACSTNVNLFYIKDIDNDISPSSFLEELKFVLPQNINHIKSEELALKQFYDYFFNQQICEIKIKNDKIYEKDFYSIPFNPVEDFPDSQINLSYYSYKMFTEDPFSFFIRYVSNQRALITESEFDISNKFLGNIAHDLMNETWLRLKETVGDNEFSTDSFFSYSGKQLNFQSFLHYQEHHPEYYYQKPHNYSNIYMEDIIWPILYNGIKEFLNKVFHDLNLYHKIKKIIPEIDKQSKNFTLPKKLLNYKLNDKNINVNIKGIADLRIHSKDNHYYVFDYKTGQSKKEQLIFYILYYYLIDNDLPFETLHAYFFNFLSYNLVSLDKLTKNTNLGYVLKEFEDSIISACKELSLCNFFPMEKPNYYGTSDIARIDLLNSKIKHNKNI